MCPCYIIHISTRQMQPGLADLSKIKAVDSSGCDSTKNPIRYLFAYFLRYKPPKALSGYW
jgi:hypothetical protein